MFRQFLPALCAALAAAPALAGPFEGVFDGVWDVAPEACAAEFSDGRISFQGHRLLYDETACTLSGQTAIEGMENAFLYNRTCRSAGESWTARALISSSCEGERLILLSDGYGFEYFRCPWTAGGM